MTAHTSPQPEQDRREAEKVRVVAGVSPDCPTCRGSGVMWETTSAAFTLTSGGTLPPVRYNRIERPCHCARLFVVLPRVEHVGDPLVPTRPEGAAGGAEP